MVFYASFNAFHCSKTHHLQDGTPIEDRRYGTRYALLTSKIVHRKSQLKKRLSCRADRGSAIQGALRTSNLKNRTS